MKKKEPNIKKAKIQLVIFLAFMAFAFAYSRVLVAKNNNIEENNNQIIENNISLVNLNKYDFNIKIMVIENNIKNQYLYDGIIENQNGNISYNNNKYLILDNEIYDKNYKKVDDIFYTIDDKYLDLNTISSYLTENNLINNTYQVKLNIVINNKEEEVYIYIDKNTNNDKIILDIDYTNLVKLENNNISSYIIEYQLYNFV